MQGTLERHSSMPLSMAQIDQPLVLRDVRAQSEMRNRLAAMGLYPGVKLKVISRSMCGPYIVVVKDCRLVLDWQTAHQIMVG